MGDFTQGLSYSSPEIPPLECDHMTPRNPNPDALAESITIILDDLGVTIDELDAREGRFRSDSERRAWFVANELRHEGLTPA